MTATGTRTTTRDSIRSTQTGRIASHGGRRTTALRRAALALLGTTALGVAGTAGSAQWTAHQLRTALGQAGVTVAHVGVSPFTGRAVLTGLTAGGRDGRIQIGRVTFAGAGALVGTAIAADPLVVSDLSVESGDFTYRIPRIEITGGNVAEADVRKLFATDGGGTLASRLGAVSATRIAAPEITVGNRRPGQEGTVTYRDVVLDDVKSGIVASAAAGGGTMVNQGPRAARGKFGSVTAQQLDLPLLARFYTETSADPSAPLKQAYAAFSVDSIELKTAQGLIVNAGKMTGSDVRLRPLQRPMAEVLGQLAATTNPKELNDAEREAYKGALADLLKSWSIGASEIAGLTIEDPGKPGAGGADARKPVHGRLGRTTFSGSGSNLTFAVADLDVRPEDGRVSVGSMSYSGSLLGPDGRLATTLTGALRVDNVAIDLPNENNSDQRVRFDMKAFSLSGTPVSTDAPVAWKLALDHAVYALPAQSEDSSLATLLALGYKSIDVSATADVAWTPTTQVLALNNVTLSGADMATVRIGGTLGNVSKDLLSGDQALAQVALAGATLKALTLSIADHGVAERLTAMQAAKDGKTPEDVRKTYGSAAAIMIPGFLGGSPQARTIGNAVARFIAKPGVLEISAKTKDAQGLGAAELMAASGNPANLLEQLDIQATAR